jgi:hypothetical protein
VKGTHSRFTTFYLQTTGMTTYSRCVFYIYNFYDDFKIVRHSISVDAMKVEERVEVQSHLLLTSALDRRKWSVSRPTAFLPSREPDIPTEQKTAWAFSNLCSGYRGVFHG